MPGVAGDRWGGPDVDTVRQAVVARLDPGDDQQTFQIVFPYPEEFFDVDTLGNHRTFGDVKMRNPNWSEAEVS